MSKFIGHFPCLNCTSSDALSIKEDSEGIYFARCFSCNYTYAHNTLAERMPELGIEKIEQEKHITIKEGSMSEPITREEFDHIKSISSLKGSGYRKIRDDILKFFGVRTSYDEHTGEPIGRYYPNTTNGKLVGFKKRIINFVDKKKKYFTIGRVGIKNELVGQYKFPTGRKYCLLVGGEEDMLAAYQMLKDSHRNSNFPEPAVVSPSTGEGSAVTQIQRNYDWFDKFDCIIVGMDNDEAGKAATEEIVKALPEDKVYTVEWPEKDPSDCLTKGKEKEFINAFWRMKKYSPYGIKTSIDANFEMWEELSREVISLPDFMKALQGKMDGGIPLGVIVNIIAQTGVGKTTTIGEAIYYWVFNSPYLPAIFSMESTAGQYALLMLSRHVGKKIKQVQSSLDFINSPEIEKKREELFYREDGEPRFLLLDDREGTPESIKKRCEILITKYGCKFIILDPLQDIFEGHSFDEQVSFMKWQKIMVKRGVTFINICHVKKLSTMADRKGQRIQRELGEDDVHGVSAIVKSAACNIILTRNKFAEDPVERNTTKVLAPKIRWSGYSGDAGEWYFDGSTYTMYDKEYYFEHINPPSYGEKEEDE